MHRLPPDRPPRVAVISPHEVVARGVAAMLDNYPDRALVTSLPSVWVKAPAADVVLYDTLALQSCDGADLDHLLLHTPAHVLIYSHDMRPDLRARAQAKGCVAWISMSCSAEELVEAIEKAAVGRFVGGHPDRVGNELGLTTREVEVLSLLTQGLSNQEIAARLYVTPSTLKTHIQRTYRQIGVSTRAQAVAWAMQHGFQPAPEQIGST
jgi:DNA-binding NarL/FixJ family response regulator